MKKSSTQKTVEELKESGLESAAESYQSINIKPSDSSSALLEILSKINKKTPSSIINTNLSECIAYRVLEMVLEVAESAEMLQEAVEYVLKKNPEYFKFNESAINFLEKANIIKITNKTLHSIVKEWKIKKHTSPSQTPKD